MKFFFTLFALFFAFISNAFGAVTYDEVTGTFLGAFDMAAYYSGVNLVFAVLGITIATGLVFGIVRKVRQLLYQGVYFPPSIYYFSINSIQGYKMLFTSDSAIIITSIFAIITIYNSSTVALDKVFDFIKKSKYV